MRPSNSACALATVEQAALNDQCLTRGACCRRAFRRRKRFLVDLALRGPMISGSRSNGALERLGQSAENDCLVNTIADECGLHSSQGISTRRIRT